MDSRATALDKLLQTPARCVLPFSVRFGGEANRHSARHRLVQQRADHLGDTFVRAQQVVFNKKNTRIGFGPIYKAIPSEV